jgi:hypothetical protein
MMGKVLHLFTFNARGAIIHFEENLNSGRHWMPDQVRHDEVGLFNCQDNMAARYFMKNSSVNSDSLRKV